MSNAPTRRKALNRAKNRYGTHSANVREAGDELLSFVVEKGWHKSELADMLGVAPSTVTRYIAGQRSPPQSTRVKIRELTGIVESRWETDGERRLAARKGATR